MSRSETLLNSVNQFYSDNKNSEILKDILEKRSGISLRNLEWFITNYSKNKIYLIPPGLARCLVFIVPINQVLMVIARNSLTPFAGRTSLNLQYREARRLLQQLLHN